MFCFSALLPLYSSCTWSSLNMIIRAALKFLSEHQNISGLTSVVCSFENGSRFPWTLWTFLLWKYGILLHCCEVLMASLWRQLSGWVSKCKGCWRLAGLVSAQTAFSLPQACVHQRSARPLGRVYTQSLGFAISVPSGGPLSPAGGPSCPRLLSLVPLARKTVASHQDL